MPEAFAAGCRPTSLMFLALFLVMLLACANAGNLVLAKTLPGATKSPSGSRLVRAGRASRGN